MNLLCKSCLLLLLFSSCCFAENTSTRTVDKDNIIYTYFKDSKPVAKQIMNSDGDVIKTIGTIPDGITRHYGPDGRLLSETSWKNNQLDGISKAYNEDGSVLREDCWEKDKFVEYKSKLHDKNGIVYVGSRGETNEHPVVILNATNESEGVSAEYKLIAMLYGRKNEDWKALKQSLIEENKKAYDLIEIELSGGTTKKIYFDITDFFGKGF